VAAAATIRAWPCREWHCSGGGGGGGGNDQGLALP